MALDPVTAAGELTRVLEEEMTRNVKRVANAMDLFLRPGDPEVGLTPRDLVYRKSKSRLYRYRGEGPLRHRVPVLMVPNLGISRPYIFDLRPGSSFIEYMVRQGFDFYLLDWGVFGEEDNGLTVDTCAMEILPAMVKKLLEASGAGELSVLGYCMGAPISAGYVATHPEVRVRNFLNFAGPIDFAKGGMFTCWLGRRSFDIDKVIDTFGSMPAEFVRVGFKMLKPTMDLTTTMNLWWNLWNDRYVEGFRALNKWANEYVPFPGEFFRQWVKDFYRDNKLIRGELVMGGRRVELRNITGSVLVVGAKEDYITPPECARALIDVVPTMDKLYLELPGGHISLIAGRQAAREVWPKVSAWLAPRSD